MNTRERVSIEPLLQRLEAGMKRTAAIEEETALKEELTEEAAADRLESMLAIVEEAPALISNSRFAKEDDSEAASPVAVALTDDKDNSAAEREASAAEAAEEAADCALL